MGEFRRDRIGDRRAHRGQAAGERRHHAAPDFQIARIPIGAGAGIARENDVVRQARRKLPRDALRVDRVGLRIGPLLQRLPRVGDEALDLGDATSDPSFACSSGSKRPERLLGVADEIDLHRIAHRQHVGLDVDLNAARLSLFRQELGIGKTRTDHQKRVAFRHQLVAGLAFRAGRSNRSPTADRPVAPPCRAAPWRNRRRACPRRR